MVAELVKAAAAERRRARMLFRRTLREAKAAMPVRIDPLLGLSCPVFVGGLALGVALDPAVVEERAATCLASITACTPVVQVGVVRTWCDAVATSFHSGCARSDRLAHMLRCPIAVPMMAQAAGLDVPEHPIHLLGLGPSTGPRAPAEASPSHRRTSSLEFSRRRLLLGRHGPRVGPPAPEPRLDSSRPPRMWPAGIRPIGGGRQSGGGSSLSVTGLTTVFLIGVIVGVIGCRFVSEHFLVKGTPVEARKEEAGRAAIEGPVTPTKWRLSHGR